MFAALFTKKKNMNMEYITTYDSPLGNITLASDGENITRLWFDSQKPSDEVMAACYEECDLQRSVFPVFDLAKNWLDVYFAGKDPGPIPPVKLNETPFRNRVCEIMQTIPYGKTLTYGHIAKQLAEEKGIEKMSAQAVGGAVGHNPISIIIPCHRVIGSDGSLTGYTGGIDIKTALLKLEGSYEQVISKK